MASSLPTDKYCFDVAQFLEETFDPATFVTAAKEFTSLEVLRDQLRAYQRDLREELYEVINRDLADYLNLSSKLSGVEAEVLEIQAPLQELATNLHETQDFVTKRKQAIQDKVRERVGLEGRRDVLEKRIEFLGTLGDVEVMLGMPGVRRGTRLGKKKPLREPGEAIDATDLTGHCSTLERLAHAWLSLTSDISCFPAGDEEDDVPTSAAVGLRLLRVEKTLLNHLAAVLRTVICPKNLVISIAAEEQEGPGAGRRTATPSAPAAAKAEEDVQVNGSALQHCLRSFIVLGRSDEAEKQIARLLMLPFIDLNFTQGRLDGGSRGSCSGLPAIYAASLSHIKRNLGQVLVLAEDCQSSVAAAAASLTLAGGGSVPLDLVCNGVWKPIHQALCSRLNSIFAPGIASILHSNYVISMNFLEDLSTLAGPTHEKAISKRIQTHLCTRDFKSRWNLPVYFHLRFTEISTKIDQALELAAGSLDEGATDAQKRASKFTSNGDRDEISSHFTHPIFVTLWQALHELWQSDVYLPPLTQRLFRLMLQIIGRFYSWLDEAFEEMHNKSSISPDKAFLRPDRPDLLVTVAWDIFLFKQESAVAHLQAQVLKAVGKTEVAGIQDIKQIAREGLTEALQPFDGLVQRAWQALHMHVVTQCFTILQAVRGITATYRMTNKRPPERASPFVVKILDPLRALEPDVKDRTPPTLAPVWRRNVVLAVTERYLDVTRELLNSVEQMEDALKKRKQRTKGSQVLTASSGLDQQQATLSDSDKIKLQLLLDVAGFGQEIKVAGGLEDPLACEPYVKLLEAVSVALQFLGRSDVKVTLPSSLETFLKTKSSSSA